jgi:hypothetical protein
MSEYELKKKYEYISLFFLILAAIAGYRLYYTGFYPVFFSPLVHDITILLLFGSLPLGLLFELCLTLLTGRGKLLKFWIKKPSVTVRHTVLSTNCSAAIEHRLGYLNFQIDRKFRDSDSEYIEFKKIKSARVYTFLDSGFSGVTKLSPLAQGGEITTQLIWNDTILFAVGEIDELQQLADYISLQHDNHKQSPKVMLFLRCGMVLAYITVLGGLCLNSSLLFQRIILTAFANTATLALIAGLILTFFKRSGLVGYRLGFLGLGFAIVPYIAGFAAYARISGL